MKLLLLVDIIALGSLDANQGDMLLGWDHRCEFPHECFDSNGWHYNEVLENGGNLHTRRDSILTPKSVVSSFEMEDLTIVTYWLGMDSTMHEH